MLPAPAAQVLSAGTDSAVKLWRVASASSAPSSLEPDADGGRYAGDECQYSRKVTCHGHGTPRNDGTCACDYGWDPAHQCTGYSRMLVYVLRYAVGPE